MTKDSSYPEIVVGAIIVNSNNKIFLGRSKRWHNQFVIPGGHIKNGENYEDAIIREVKEETNIDIIDINVLKVRNRQITEKNNKVHDYIFIDYYCKASNSDVSLNYEFENYIWIDPTEALELDLAETVRELIEKYLQKSLAY